jgi:hypothetical protein
MTSPVRLSRYRNRCAEEDTLFPVPIGTMTGPGSQWLASNHTVRFSQSAQGGGVDPFVAQLGLLCTTHRTRAKWVFVPTHALGSTLGDRLVLEQHAMADDRRQATAKDKVERVGCR